MHKECTGPCHLPIDAIHIAAIYHQHTAACIKTDLFVATKMLIKAKKAKARVAD